MLDVLSLVCLAAVAGSLLIVLANVLFWPRPSARLADPAATISVLIPARNEEKNIGGAVRSALASGASVAEVIVYDDRSDDGTARVVAECRREDARVRIVRGDALPEGWFGKPNACARLAAEARGDWLLFLDADARLAPWAADALLWEATRRGATLLSAWPALVMRSFWERTLMPMLNVVTLSLFPAPLSFLRDDPSLGLAHGACILAHRTTYARTGGHGAVRAQIFEDTRLAQHWRRCGEVALCVDGQDAVQVRMYAGFGEIWHGFQKNFYPAFSSQFGFWAFLLLHALVFIAPFALFLAHPGRTTALAAAGTLAMRALLARRFGHPWSAIVMHPLAEAVLIGIGISSWWRCVSGQGVDWKGRRYLATADAVRGRS